jgi:hypothetical protein
MVGVPRNAHTTEPQPRSVESTSLPLPTRLGGKHCRSCAGEEGACVRVGVEELLHGYIMVAPRNAAEELGTSLSPAQKKKRVSGGKSNSLTVYPKANRRLTVHTAILPPRDVPYTLSQPQLVLLILPIPHRYQAPSSTLG